MMIDANWNIASIYFYHDFWRNTACVSFQLEAATSGFQVTDRPDQKQNIGAKLRKDISTKKFLQFSLHWPFNRKSIHLIIFVFF